MVENNFFKTSHLLSNKENKKKNVETVSFFPP